MFKKSVICSLLLFTAHAYASEKIQLRLHFDINKTIIAEDKIQKKDLETTINGILAEYTYASWDGEHTQSYYAYVTKNIQREHQTISQTSEAFKQHRARHLQLFPKYLEHAHPELHTKYLQEKAQMMEALHGTEGTIFPSFFATLAWLNEEYPNQYAIYLRTFGNDLPEVVSIIQKHTPITFINHGTDLTVKQKRNVLIAATTESTLNHWALQDDYDYWKEHGFQAVGGKPFVVDVNDHNTITLFFDDNADDPEKPIICPLKPNGKPENTETLLARGHIVTVNPKQAILDTNYFIDKIKAMIARQQTVVTDPKL